MLRRPFGRSNDKFSKWGDAKVNFKSFLILGDIANIYIRENHPLFENSGAGIRNTKNGSIQSSTSDLLTLGEAPRIISKRGRPRRDEPTNADGDIAIRIPRKRARDLATEQPAEEIFDNQRKRRNVGLPKHFDNMLMMDQKKRAAERVESKDKINVDLDNDGNSDVGLDVDEVSRIAGEKAGRKRGRPTKQMERENEDRSQKPVNINPETSNNPAPPPAPPASNNENNNNRSAFNAYNGYNTHNSNTTQSLPHQQYPHNSNAPHRGNYNTEIPQPHPNPYPYPHYEPNVNPPHNPAGENDGNPKRAGFHQFFEHLREFFTMVGAWYGVSGPIILHYLREQILPVLRVLSANHLPRDTANNLIVQISRSLSSPTMSALFLKLIGIGRGFPLYSAIVHSLRQYDQENLYGMRSMHYFVEPPPMEVFNIYLRKVVEALNGPDGPATFRAVAMLMEEIVTEWKNYDITLEKRLEKIAQIDRLLPENVRGLRARLYHVLMLPTTIMSRTLQQQQELDEKHVLCNADAMVGEGYSMLLKTIGQLSMRETGVVPSGLTNTVLFNNVAFIKPANLTPMQHPAMATVHSLDKTGFELGTNIVANGLHNIPPNLLNGISKASTGQRMFHDINMSNDRGKVNGALIVEPSKTTTNLQQVYDERERSRLEHHQRMRALAGVRPPNAPMHYGSYSSDNAYSEQVAALMNTKSSSGSASSSSGDSNISSSGAQSSISGGVSSSGGNSGNNASSDTNSGSTVTDVYGMRTPDFPEGQPVDQTKKFLRDVAEKVPEQYKQPFTDAMRSLFRSIREKTCPAEEIEARMLLVQSFIPHQEVEFRSNIVKLFRGASPVPFPAGRASTAASTVSDVDGGNSRGKNSGVGVDQGTSNSCSNSAYSSGSSSSHMNNLGGMGGMGIGGNNVFSHTNNLHLPTPPAEQVVNVVDSGSDSNSDEYSSSGDGSNSDSDGDGGEDGNGDDDNFYDNKSHRQGDDENESDHNSVDSNREIGSDEEEEHVGDNNDVSDNIESSYCDPIVIDVDAAIVESRTANPLVSGRSDVTDPSVSTTLLLATKPAAIAPTIAPALVPTAIAPAPVPTATVPSTAVERDHQAAPILDEVGTTAVQLPSIQDMERAWSADSALLSDSHHSSSSGSAPSSTPQLLLLSNLTSTTNPITNMTTTTTTTSASSTGAGKSGKAKHKQAVAVPLVPTAPSAISAPSISTSIPTSIPTAAPATVTVAPVTVAAPVATTTSTILPTPVANITATSAPIVTPTSTGLVNWRDVPPVNPCAPPIKSAPLAASSASVSSVRVPIPKPTFGVKPTAAASYAAVAAAAKAVPSISTNSTATAPVKVAKPSRNLPKPIPLNKAPSIDKDFTPSEQTVKAAVRQAEVSNDAIDGSSSAMDVVADHDTSREVAKLVDTSGIANSSGRTSSGTVTVTTTNSAGPSVTSVPKFGAFGISSSSSHADIRNRPSDVVAAIKANVATFKNAGGATSSAPVPTSAPVTAPTTGRSDVIAVAAPVIIRPPGRPRKSFPLPSSAVSVTATTATTNASASAITASSTIGQNSAAVTASSAVVAKSSVSDSSAATVKVASVPRSAAVANGGTNPAPMIPASTAVPAVSSSITAKSTIDKPAVPTTTSKTIDTTKVASLSSTSTNPITSNKKVIGGTVPKVEPFQYPKNCMPYRQRGEKDSKTAFIDTDFDSILTRGTALAGPVRTGEDKDKQLTKALAFYLDPLEGNYEMSITLLADTFRVPYVKLKGTLKREIEERLAGFDEKFCEQLEAAHQNYLLAKAGKPTSSSSNSNSSSSSNDAVVVSQGGNILHEIAQSAGVPILHLMMWTVKAKASSNRFRTKPGDLRAKLQDMFTMFYRLKMEGGGESKTALAKKFNMNPALFSRKLLELPSDQQNRYKKLAMKLTPEEVRAISDRYQGGDEGVAVKDGDEVKKAVASAPVVVVSSGSGGAVAAQTTTSEGGIKMPCVDPVASATASTTSAAAKPVTTAATASTTTVASVQPSTSTATSASASAVAPAGGKVLLTPAGAARLPAATATIPTTTTTTSTTAASGSATNTKNSADEANDANSAVDSASRSRGRPKGSKNIAHNI